jgi:coenzyme Q-binding protein COQ10
LPTFETTRRVPFTAEEMFAVVADVARYPAFVPLCEKLDVLKREARGPETVIMASMGVGYGPVRETFTSIVTLRPPYEIDVVNLDGPFSRLANRWRFRDVPDGSEVYFHIDYEFASRLLAALMGAMFDKAVRKYTAAFEARAATLYGQRTAVGGQP